MASLENYTHIFLHLQIVRRVSVRHKKLNNYIKI